MGWRPEARKSGGRGGSSEQPHPRSEEEPHYQERQPEGEDEDVLLGYTRLDLADRPREGLTHGRDAVGDAVDDMGVYPVTRLGEVYAQVCPRVVDPVQPPDLE